MRQAILIQLLLVITLINCEKINLVSYKRFDSCILNMKHYPCVENNRNARISLVLFKFAMAKLKVV